MSPLRLRSLLNKGQCTRRLAYQNYISSYPRIIQHTTHFPSTTRQHSTSSSRQRRPCLVNYRTYSTTESPPTTIQDPQKPSIYYHVLSAPNPLSNELPAYAVSMLDQPPKDAYSPAIMGWLVAASPETDQEAGIGDFKGNDKFLEVLHDVVRTVADERSDERLLAEAIQLGVGWMHINDDRNLPELGRISSPDDIIGSVRVEDGVILPGTYNPMPTYRICTTDGLTTLSKGLEDRLVARLRELEGL
ncbi:hypothetical protein M422DRAFT_163965 [Sphaerobolus stellatus SS14]|nr:hypothetical protein M422DRAFT_163965 [Sphaerobolus stellatus SS14]